MPPSISSWYIVVSYSKLLKGRLWCGNRALSSHTKSHHWEGHWVTILHNLNMSEQYERNLAWIYLLCYFIKYIYNNIKLYHIISYIIIQRLVKHGGLSEVKRSIQQLQPVQALVKHLTKNCNWSLLQLFPIKHLLVQPVLTPFQPIDGIQVRRSLEAPCPQCLCFKTPQNPKLRSP